MSKGIFVIGTGTDVGKTYVTGLLVKKLRQMGWNAGYYKAALSGAVRVEQELVPGDATYVAEAAGLEKEPKKLVSYCYEHAVSPHLAAKLEGNPVELSVVKEDYQKLCKEYDYIAVEGSGGIVCPIRYDENAHIFLEDIIKALELDTILVADAGLGTINSVVLTAEYLKQRNMKIRGILFNRFSKESLMEQDNKEMVELLTGIPVIGFVEEGDAELFIEEEQLKRLFGEAETVW